MTLTDIIAHVTDKLNKTDAQTLAVAKKFAIARHKMIYDAALWTESQVLLAITPATTTDVLILPEFVDIVMAVTWQDLEVKGAELGTYFQLTPTALDNTNTATPLNWSKLTTSAVKADPNGETLDFISDNTADTSAVTVYGQDASGDDIGETVTLNGTTTVTTTNSYSLVTQISKLDTSGIITVTNTVSSTQLLVLKATEHAKSHRRIKLVWAPQEIQTVRILAKRTIQKYEDDQDSPALNGIDNMLIAYASADMLKRFKQYGKAQLELQEGDALMAAFQQKDTEQDGVSRRIIPDPSVGYGQTFDMTNWWLTGPTGP